MRALIRCIAAASVIIAFAWMVGNAAHILIALLALILAVLAGRSSLRNVPPPYAPTLAAPVFPDPPAREWGFLPVPEKS